MLAQGVVVLNLQDGPGVCFCDEPKSNKDPGLASLCVLAPGVSISQIQLSPNKITKIGPHFSLSSLPPPTLPCVTFIDEDS